MNLTELNGLSSEKAITAFMQCCTSTMWVNAMVDARPFNNEQALVEQADNLWQQAQEVDYLEAFDGHPKIGDVNSLREKYVNTKALASNEQGLVKVASDQVLADLAQGNSDYQNKFGFIFIVCATGKSAQQMLDLLQARLVNDRTKELIIGAEEQRKIFQIRINKLLTRSA